MGCVCSRVEEEETVRRCRERRRLMKQLLSCRRELFAAHMAYLHSLRNTGATLRQFSEVEPIIPGGSSPLGIRLPPSPPPPLPPSPPPPPAFSPEVKSNVANEVHNAEENLVELNDNESCTPPPPPVLSSTWNFWDPFGPPSSSNSSSLVMEKKDGDATPVADGDEEYWAETKSEFEEEEVAGVEEIAHASIVNLTLTPVKVKPPMPELTDDCLSAVSGYTKDTDMAVVVWRSKRTLAGIVKELDDYFLKAAAGGKDVVGFLEYYRGPHLHSGFEEKQGRRSKSAKVFHSLSWSCSFRYSQSNRSSYVQDRSDACRSGYHCNTLEQIYAKEQKLYKEVKEEENANHQLKRKTQLLHKLEASDQDSAQTQNIQSEIESLQSQIISLQESINETCLSISKLRDEELHPQLVELTFGLLQMWRTMYECHQVQNHIAQQVNLVDKHPGTEPTTDSHRQATAQLETEVTSWYSSFCNLLGSQREYFRILNQWVRLTDCLPDHTDLTISPSGIHSLCEELQLALDRLPDKVAAEAIKSLLLVIHSIVLQQTEERSLQKKSDRLETRLEKELNSLDKLEKYEETSTRDLPFSGLNYRILPSRYAKLESLKKKAEEEKAKFLNSVCITGAMTMNNLHTSLPNVFQALMGFASVCVQVLEGVHRPTREAAATGHGHGQSEGVSVL